MRVGIGWSGVCSALMLSLWWCAGCSESVDDASADAVDVSSQAETVVAEDAALTSDAGPAVSEPDTASADDATVEVQPEASAQNVLLIIADDLGLDHSECYGAPGELAATPTLRGLCEQGVVFTNAWAMPTCSPTRATMLTGRYPMRHGVGAPSGGEQPGLGAGELTLPQVLDASPELGVAHANIGKWHLSAGLNIDGDPNDFGWGHFSGIVRGVVNDYYAWIKVVDGVSEAVETYATTALVDDAIGWVDAQDGPWVLWLALNAPHSPFHIPPTGLHSQALPETPGPCPNGSRETCYRAAIEAMDTEIGRLLDSLDAETRANTTIIYLGDNGTPGTVAQAPVDSAHAKGTLYEGGVHVPFVIQGPTVVQGGRSVDAIIDVSDVFATVLRLAGVDQATLDAQTTTTDSVSLTPYLADPEQTPLRAWTVSELHTSQTSEDQPGKAIRDARFKLILFQDGREELYDLLADAWESTELIGSGALDTEAQAAYDDLSAILAWLEVTL
jgi:arylsulfatase A-like enzyme